MPGGVHALDAGEARSLVKRVEQTFEDGALALGLDLDRASVRQVADAPAQAELARPRGGEAAKVDALDQPVHDRMQAGAVMRRRTAHRQPPSSEPRPPEPICSS